MAKAVWFLCFVGIVFAAPKSETRHSLQNHLDDFIKLIPLDEIKLIVINYLNNDEEVQEIFEYVQSDKFKAAIDKIKEDKTISELESFFYGLRVSEELFTFKPEDVQQRPLKGKGLKGLLQEVNATLPHEKLRAMFQEKLQVSSEFKTFHEKISSDDVKKFIQRTLDIPEIRELVVKIQNYGVDVNEILNVGKGLMGWNSEDISI